VVDVRRLDRRQFARHVDEAARIYGLAMARPPEVVAQRQAIITHHLDYDGFRATGALLTGRLVGFGYGYTGANGQWWHDAVAAGLGPEGSSEWLQDVFEVAELHVLPAHQHEGVGRRLLGALLDRLPHRTALLSTPDRESSAKRLYRKAGFVELLAGFRFPGGAEAYCVMGCRLAAAQ
jgi:GNAT superfamily N-acetyltransferase